MNIQNIHKHPGVVDSILKIHSWSGNHNDFLQTFKVSLLSGIYLNVMPEQYAFILTTNCKIKPSKVISFQLKENELQFNLPEIIPFWYLKKDFNKFFNSLNVPKLDYNDLLDQSYLKSHSFQNENIQNLLGIVSIIDSYISKIDRLNKNELNNFLATNPLNKLKDYPLDICFFVIKYKIQLHRLIKYCLDERDVTICNIRNEVLKLTPSFYPSIPDSILEDLFRSEKSILEILRTNKFIHDTLLSV